MTRSPQDTREVELGCIVIDADTQARASIDRALVDRYAEMWRAGIEFDALQAIEDEQTGRLYLIDGFHRLAAAAAAKRATVPVQVVEVASQRRAQWLCLGVNAKHGKPLTNADKRRAVERVLADDEWAKMSDRAIAKHVGCGRQFVGNMRREWSTVHGGQSSERVGADGRTINTANIGGKPSPKRDDQGPSPAASKASEPQREGRPTTAPSSSPPKPPASRQAKPAPEHKPEPETVTITVSELEDLRINRELRRKELQGAHKVVEQLRGEVARLERELAEARAKPATVRFARGLDPLALLGARDKRDAKSKYRALAKAAHPDRGGSHELMTLIQQIWDAVP